MRLNKQEIIRELEGMTSTQIDQLKAWQEWHLDALNQKPESGGWSILECMEHLRRYMEFYIPEMRAKMKTASSSSKDSFRTGWLGNYAAKSMLPDEGSSIKMKTFPSKNPEGSDLDTSVLYQLEGHLNQLIELLKNSKDLDWDRTKVKTTLGPLIRFKLGDMFRFLIYHNYRHFRQAQRISSTN